MMKQLLLLLATVALVMGCQLKQTSEQDFVRVENGHFVRGGKPYYYVGTNFWYGAILGSEGQGGDRARLLRELDEMKRMGIDNLRILVGSDGERGVKTKVEPTLQEKPGVYNDTILAGLDYLLMEMGKRDMLAVLYLNNSWEWSGGYGFYLEHAGAGKQPRPDDVGYPAFMEAMSKYAINEKAHQLFYDYVRFIVGRTNRYTGKAYKDDPAIMSWQIGNEPRAFSTEALPAFEKWLSEASGIIREMDPNHLISIGSEGAWGCENDFGCWERICADQNVDYCNVHLWPYNWGWAKPDSLIEHLPRANGWASPSSWRSSAIRATVFRSRQAVLPRAATDITATFFRWWLTMPNRADSLPAVTSGGGAAMPVHSTSSGRWATTIPTTPPRKHRG